MGLLTLVCQFRSQGIQWPLRDGDTIEIRDGLETIGEVSADMVIELLVHHFRLAQMATRLMQSMNGLRALPPARMPPRAVPIEVQEQRRLKRRYPKRTNQ